MAEILHSMPLGEELFLNYGKRVPKDHWQQNDCIVPDDKFHFCGKHNTLCSCIQWLAYFDHFVRF